MKMFKKDSNAVSPVIGVMLMLVVTVILAAAVSSTSTGLIKSSGAAPTAIFDVECVKDVDDGYGNILSYLSIKEVTGDAIDTADLKIVVTANGTLTETLPLSGDVAYSYDYEIAGTSYTNYVTGVSAPYMNNPGVGYVGDAAVDFGNYTLKPGITMTADWYDNYYDSVENTSLYTMIPNWDDLDDGDFINVKIVHTPSEKVIFATDVEVV